jgi:type I restriction enzyme S subunit
VKGDDEIVTAFRDGQVTLRALRRQEGFTNADKEIGYHGVEPGDLVVHAMDAFAGAIGVSSSRGKMSPVAHCWRVEGGDERYIAYVLRHFAFSGRITALAKGIRERSTAFDPSTLLDLTLPWPEKAQQRRIANFLDDQVGRLDVAASAARDVTALVEHRHEALRQYHVDRLADVERRPLRSLFGYFTDGDWIESPFISESGIRFLQTGNVGVGRLRLDAERYITRETFAQLHCKWVRPGDVLVCRLGSPVSRAAIVPESLQECVTSVDVVIARHPGPQVLARFVAEYLSTAAHLEPADQLARGATMQRLSRSQVGALRIPVPSLEGQRDMIGALEASAEQRDAAMKDAERLVALLQERKRALITACVTGEFDVSTASARAGDAALAHLPPVSKLAR